MEQVEARKPLGYEAFRQFNVPQQTGDTDESVSVQESSVRKSNEQPFKSVFSDFLKSVKELNKYSDHETESQS